MREILFRAKRKDNGEWVEGNYILQNDSDPNRSNYMKPYIQLRNCVNRYEVIPETVGQFIGLVDKKNTKIFEGDIVKWVIDEKEVNERERIYDEGIGEVIYEASSFELSKEQCLLCCFDNNKVFILEVIGNIHDSPQMLE